MNATANTSDLEPVTYRTNNEYGVHQNSSAQKSDIGTDRTPKYLEDKYKNLETLPQIKLG